MKKHLINLGAVLSVLFITACAGIHAREQTQVPAMQLAYNEVIKPHVERGLSTIVDENQRFELESKVRSFESALDSGEYLALSAQRDTWRDPVRMLFAAGLQERVDAGELGPNGAKVLMETAVQFDANMTLLGAR